LNAKTLRIEPALNIPRALVDEVLEKFEETLTDLND
jgi:acetylornithine/succinyldiaminopimelate/putrescine aminotransferase